MTTDALQDLANLRDLGGVATAGGQRIRLRQVYRSAMLDTDSTDLVRQIKALNLRAILDLRENSERAGFPTHWKTLNCCEYWYRDYVDGGSNLAHMLSNPATTVHAIRAEMIETYRIMPIIHRDAYRELFSRLAQGQTPILFHCTAGKDRTGVAAALILAALDTPMESILDDYLQTNSFDLRARVLRRLASSRHPQLFSNAFDHLIAASLAADSSFLEAMFDRLRADYGSPQAYLADVLEIDHTRLNHIREHLLEADGGTTGVVTGVDHRPIR